MAQYNGYVPVVHNSYSAWRAATLGNGYNVDFSFGNQCWDYCALLYWQYGLTLITKPGGGVAADCWNYSRNANSRTPFISITGKENIKRGDIIVWNKSSSSSTGHIGFADEDYRGNEIYVLSQMPTKYGIGGTVHRDLWGLNTFLGVFRNTLWTESPEPPTPSSSSTKKHFPWPVAWAHWSNFKH